MSERELEEREIERLQRTALKKKTTNQPTTVPKWKQQQNNPPPPIKKVEPVKKNTPIPVNSSSYVETEQQTKNENIIVECSPFIKSGNPQDNKSDMMDKEMQRLMGYTNVPVNTTQQSNGEQDKHKDEEKIIEERSPFIKNDENKEVHDEDKEMQRLMGYKNVQQMKSNTQQDKQNKNENVIVAESSPFIKSNTKSEDEKKNEMMEREMQRLMGHTNIPTESSDDSSQKVEPPKKGENIFVSLLPYITSKPQESIFDVKETKITDEEREMNRLLGYTQTKKNSV